jgi:hypothetical protein
MIDVAVDDFDRLPNLSVTELLQLTQSLLYRFPLVSLDPEQEASWRDIDSS